MTKIILHKQQKGSVMTKEDIKKIKKNFWYDKDLKVISKSIDRNTDTYKQLRLRSDELQYIKTLARKYTGGNVSLLMVYAAINFPFKDLK
jgi:hypothetical protein